MAREKAVACMFCDKAPCECNKPAKPAPKIKQPTPVVEITKPAPLPPAVPAPRRPIGAVRMVRPAAKAAPATPAPPRIVRPPAQPAPKVTRSAFTNVKRVSSDPETDAAIELLRSVFGEVELLGVEHAAL